MPNLPKYKFALNKICVNNNWFGGTLCGVPRGENLETHPPRLSAIVPHFEHISSTIYKKIIY